MQWSVGERERERETEREKEGRFRRTNGLYLWNAWELEGETGTIGISVEF